MFPIRPLYISIVLVVSLSACGTNERSHAASAAKSRMVGLTREEVLACMGPPKKKASEGQTEVWSYLSTNGYGEYGSASSKVTGILPGLTSYSGGGSHTRSFCTVNIVMRNGIVGKVNYNGPSDSGYFSPDEQCGYAVSNCVEADSH